MGCDIHMYAEVYDETNNEWVFQKNKFYDMWYYEILCDHLKEYFNLTNRQCKKVIDYYYSGKKSRDLLEKKIIEEYLPNSLKVEYDSNISLGNLPDLLTDEVYNYRNYDLFRVLNNVRGYTDVHIVDDFDMRDLPEDLSIEIKGLYLEGEEDYHSTSYLYLNEIIESEINKDKTLPNGVKFFLKHSVKTLKKLNGDYKKIRIVFWFDN